MELNRYPQGQQASAIYLEYIGRLSPMKYLLILLLMLSLNSYAATQLINGSPSLHRVGSDTISLEQAVEKVRREHGGRILAADTLTENNRSIHVIKVLTADNIVRTLRIPAGNGN